MFGFQIVEFDTLRVVGYASISGSYVVLGTALGHTCRLMCITNTTDGDMFISNDGVNDKLIIPANSFKLFDLATNHPSGENETFQARIGTQFWVRQSSMPTKGSVYLELLYAVGE